MFNYNRHQGLKMATLALVTISAAVVAQGSTLAASSKPSDSKKMLSAFTPPSQISVEKTVDGGSFLQDMLDAANALKSYSFEYDTTVFKGSKTISQTGVLYFKAPPKQMRVEMTGDYRKGSVAVLNKDGKVRGHMGGALSMITVTLSPNSDQLMGANGFPMLDSDLAAMYGVVKKYVAQGCKVKVTEDPVAVEGQPKRVYVFECYKGPNAGELYKRAYIDPKSLLPVEWFDYQDGRLFAHTVWKNVKQDPNMPDSLFQI